MHDGKQLYMIQYNDLSNVMYYFDDIQINMLFGATERQQTALLPGFGLLVTKDIRAIVLQLVTDEEPEDNPSYDPDLTEEEKEWVRQVDLADKLHAEYGDEDKDSDTDYEGGMMA